MSERMRDTAPRLAALAAQALGWRPDDFWRATPAELAMSLSPPTHRSPAPMTRGDLETLMERERDG